MRLEARFALEALNDLFMDTGKIDRLFSHFAKAHHSVLIVIAIDRQRHARSDLLGALRSHAYEIEAVGDVEDAVFYGDASHRGTPRKNVAGRGN